MPANLTAALARALRSPARSPRPPGLGSPTPSGSSGTVEGRPGLTVDRYGSILVQSFHDRSRRLRSKPSKPSRRSLPLPRAVLQRPQPRQLAHRRPTRCRPSASCRPLSAVSSLSWASMLGAGPPCRAGPAGKLFDLRAARRRVMAEAAGKSLLNVFAYTCGVLAAAKAGAEPCGECGFRRIQPRRGRDNARLNDPADPRALREERRLRPPAPACRHRPAEDGRGSLPPFELAPHQFDVVFSTARYARARLRRGRSSTTIFKPALPGTQARRHADLLQQRNGWTATFAE